MRREAGFTLIELMIVVAIIGVLAAIAIPAYQDYIARAQVSEALSLLSAAKAPLAEHYADKGRWPLEPASVGLSGAGRYVVSNFEFIGAGSAATSLSVLATLRSTEVSSAVRGRKLMLETTDGGMIWSCRRSAGPDGIAARYLPSACR
jgi:type IV pilus assembly protein PilA